MHPKRLLNLTGDRLYSMPLLVLYLTDGCNSRCVTCDIWRNPRRNMPLALVDSLVEACHELGVKHVLLSGGESMQHPEWATIAAKFREVGVRVMLLTNGLLVRKQIEQVAGHVDELIVSLDGGTAATYEAIRGVDAFDLVLEGIDLARKANLPVTTRTTVQQMNFRELPQIVEVALTHDVNLVSFLAMDMGNPFAFGERTTESVVGALSREEVNELEAILEEMQVSHTSAFDTGLIAESSEKLKRILVQYFRALNGDLDFPRPQCNAPHFSTVIEWDGRLRPCYFLPTYGRLQPEGDSLQQAINWEAAQDLRRAYRMGQREECAWCVCPLYKSARNLVRM